MNKPAAPHPNKYKKKNFKKGIHTVDKGMLGGMAETENTKK